VARWTAPPTGPGSPRGFFEALGTSLEDELARYHHVIFFETAAVGGHSIASGNPARIESEAAAVALDKGLRTLWQQHPRFPLRAARTQLLGENHNRAARADRDPGRCAEPPRLKADSVAAF
jgi:hypothetical protein